MTIKANDGTPAVADCPTCEGTGEIEVRGESVNPRNGIRGYDPQEDRSYRCPDCGGTGAADR